MAKADETPPVLIDEKKALARMKAQPEALEEAIDILCREGGEAGRRRAARRAVKEILLAVPVDPAWPAGRPATIRRKADVMEIRARQLRRDVLELAGLYGGYAEAVRQAGLSGTGSILDGLRRQEDEELERCLGVTAILAADEDSFCNRSPLYTQLEALEGLCREILKKVRPDKGGGRSLLEWQLGPPKIWLVREAGLRMSRFTGRPLASTFSAPFYNFCCALLELAWGIDPAAKGVGLRTYVEFAAPRINRINEIDAGTVALSVREQRGYLLPGEDPEALRHEHRQLHYELSTFKAVPQNEPPDIGKRTRRRKTRHPKHRR